MLVFDGILVCSFASLYYYLVLPRRPRLPAIPYDWLRHLLLAHNNILRPLRPSH